jgi:hypothetical protein
MFKFFGSKIKPEKLAQRMFSLAIEVNIGKEKEKAVKSVGIDNEIYVIELIGFQLYSVLFGYLVWQGRTKFGENEDNAVVDEFHILIKNWCSQISPRPKELFNHIQDRFNEYHEAQRKDWVRSEKDSISMELTTNFLKNIAPHPHEIPYEFMEAVSARFNSYVTKTADTLNK